jgi:hypothetical protein
VLVEVEAAELSRGTVLEELGAVLLVPFVEFEFAPGAVVAFWSVVLDGAAVGFDWLGV